MSKIISGFLTLPIIGGVLHFIITIVLAGFLALTYTTLTKEVPIATLTFSTATNNSKVFTAHLFDEKNSRIGDYTLYGDQWRLDAGFIKMEYWANILGLDSKYTLNRLEGRYENIDDENSQKHKAYQIEDHNLIDNLSFFFDTSYGSSVYKKIKLNTKFIVLKTQTGLMVREKALNVQKEKSLLDKTKDLFGL